MQENPPCSIRLLDAAEALGYGTLLAQESRSEFIRTAIKERARELLERVSPTKARKQGVESAR